jgi:hypothetical protein
LPFIAQAAGSEFKKYSLSGSSLDTQWRISCEAIIIPSYSLSVTNGGTRDVVTMTVTCGLASRLLLKRNESGHANSPRKIVADILNFRLPAHGKFVCSALSRDIVFERSSNAKAAEELMKSGRTLCGVFSTVEVPVCEDETVETAEELLKNILGFISLLSLNETRSPVIKLVSDGQDISISVSDVVRNRYHGNVLIDDVHVHDGIRRSFCESYATYASMINELDLVRVLGLVREAQTQRYLEMKCAALLMAYECFLTAYLVSQGEDRAAVSNYNIQQKIGKANGYLRFIPAGQLGDALREGIRNPLFHQGMIPAMSSDEVYSTYVGYFDLLLRMILRVLKYTGKFISRVTYRPINV